MSATSLPTDVFTLTYQEAERVLVGRWLRDTPEADLYPSYEQLIAVAKDHGQCRLWLLDMRRRAWHSDSFAAWFGNLLARQVVKQIGTPVFIAYLADESHRTAIESVATDALLQRVAQVEFYPYFFVDETAAREWLVYYHTHAGEKPALPQG